MSDKLKVPAAPKGDIVVRIGGKSFRCACGCNVFRHPESKPDVYQCNGCQAQYIADE